jgi:RNase H-like domain found in reverse transcriptase
MEHNIEKPIYLMIDTSEIGMGASLIQSEKVGDKLRCGSDLFKLNDGGYEISYLFTSFSKAERRYIMIKMEFLVILNATKHFWHIICWNENRLKIFTDH